MKKSQTMEKPDLEFFHKLLLQRLNAVRQQTRSQQMDSEEERIELALKRIGWGNYRSCMECGENIGAERLTADPTALTCETCAMKR